MDMFDMGPFPFPLMLIAVVIIIIVMTMGSARGPRSFQQDMPRSCPECGTVHPGYANYCRRCGKRLR